MSDAGAAQGRDADGSDDESVDAQDAERLEERRVAAVERLQLVDTPAEERFDRITRVARELFNVPIAEINLINDQDQFTKSPQYGGSGAKRHRTESFCDITIQRPGLLVVPDATKDDRFSWRDVVTSDQHIRFYAGRPLSLGEDLRVGTLCIVDTEPHELDEEELRLFEEMGLWAERELLADIDIDRAADVQRGFLPGGQPCPPEYAVAGVSLPHGGVGGDFHTWTATDDGFEFTVADVMGKGTAGAILATDVRAAFLARVGGDVGRTVTEVNAQVAQDLATTGSFATLVHARVDRAGRLDYADAGHGLTIIVRTDGGVERLDSTGLPIGILDDGVWTTLQTEIAPGETLVVCTDGVLDLFDGTLDSLDGVARLVTAGGGPAAIVERLVALSDTQQRSDDLTAVVITRAG
ncbi:PP2C family protein-serine/threonine phosphatase [Plantibacter sp. Mn2098]|uniref:PP2C family protein-serine/threonine phosphatase n=1 Tax=Plantibacter sp. Mn2098 TaxID=3395266 RepID=UPI003BD7731D